ncbi:unnamed protein product [Gongylonema pulchrum]|uniref:Transmembrane protein n=1 Tax=Gongylonema pulchrum TaxID=637853 RepID=A0A183CY12_9BILA|nr:unnamed protein product [Gongylonema pulchrum]
MAVTVIVVLTAIRLIISGIIKNTFSDSPVTLVERSVQTNDWGVPLEQVDDISTRLGRATFRTERAKESAILAMPANGALFKTVVQPDRQDQTAGAAMEKLTETVQATVASMDFMAMIDDSINSEDPMLPNVYMEKALHEAGYDRQENDKQPCETPSHAFDYDGSQCFGSAAPVSLASPEFVFSGIDSSTFPGTDNLGQLDPFFDQRSKREREDRRG